MQKRIYLCLAHMSGNEMKFVQEAFDTNWVVPLGPNVDGFEKDLEEFVNRREISPRASLGRNDKEATLGRNDKGLVISTKVRRAAWRDLQTE